MTARPCPGCGVPLSKPSDAHHVACTPCWFRVPWRLRKRFLSEFGHSWVAHAQLVSYARDAHDAVVEWLAAHPVTRETASVPAWKIDRRSQT